MKKKNIFPGSSFLAFAFSFYLIFTPFFSLSYVHASVNKQINYQGKLTNASNVAVASSTYNMEFKLYTVPTGGSPIWTETRTGSDKVSIINGLFSVMLGEVSSLDAVNFNQTLYLGVNIGGTGSPSWDGEMTPRKKLGSVPSAFEAENLGGASSTQYVRNDQTNIISTTSASAIVAIVQNGTGPGLSVTGGTSLQNASTTNFSVSGNSYLGTILSGTWNGSTVDVAHGGTGATSLTGVLKGNGTGAFTAMNGTANYVTRWTDANTLGTGTLYDNGTNVGVGNASPSYKLDVAGNVYAGTSVGTSMFTGQQLGGTYSFSDGIFKAITDNPNGAANYYFQGITGGAAGTTNFFVRANGDGYFAGNVGIGTASPGEKLSVAGDAIFGNGLSNLNIGGGDGTDAFPNSIGFNRDVSTGAIYNSGVSGWQFSARDTSFRLEGYNGAANDALTVLKGGNVGIGNASPSYKLDVDGAIKAGGGNNGWGNALLTAGNEWGNAGAYYPTLTSTGSGGLIMLINPHMPFTTNNNFFGRTGKAGIRMAADAASSAYWDAGVTNNGYEILYGGNVNLNPFSINTSGQVGIGTNAPNSALHVAGGAGSEIRNQGDNGYYSWVNTAGVRQSYIQNTSGLFKFANENTGGFLFQTAGASDALTILNGGNVGIGNTNPSYKLDVAGDLHLSNGGDVRLSPAISGGDVGFYSDNGEINFFTNGGASVPVLITAGGNMGIGTTTPDYKLTVAGDANITGALRFNGDAGTTGYILQSNASGAPTWVATSTLAGNFFQQNGNAFGATASLGTTDSQSLVFKTNNIARMTLDASGNIGVASTTPSGTFSVGTRGASSPLASAFTVTGGYYATTGLGQSIDLVAGRGNTLSAGGVVNIVGGAGNAAGGGAVNITGGSSGIVGSLIGSAVTINGGSQAGGTQGSVLLETTGGNVGIGTTTPGYKLTLAGDANITAALRFNGSAGSTGQVLQSNGSSAPTWVATSTLGFAPATITSGLTTNYITKWNGTKFVNSITYDDGTNVGIGTTDPSVGGTSVSKFTIAQSDGVSGLVIGNGTAPRFALNGQSNGSWTMYDYAAGSYIAGITQSSGNVGIGNSSPSYKLDVNGTGRFASGLALTGTDGSQLNGNGSTLSLTTNGIWNSLAGSLIQLTSSDLNMWSNGGSFNFKNSFGANVATLNTATGAFSVGGPITAADIGGAGTPNLYIGDDTFFTDLDSADAVGLYGSSNNAVASLYLGNAGGYISGANGNIGINNGNPGYPLTVNGRISYSGAIGEGADTTLSSAGTVLLHGISSTWTEQRFYTGGNQVMTLLSNGNVGIGSTTPAAKLAVAGDAIITGTLTAGIISSNTWNKWDIDAEWNTNDAGGTSRVYKDGINVPHSGISRGINTWVFDRQGNLLTSFTNDLYGNPNEWNTWADAVNARNNGEVIVVTSADAIGQVPSGGSAETLLKSVGSSELFKIPGNYRYGVAFAFIKGNYGIVEKIGYATTDRGMIRTSYQSLINISQGKYALNSTETSTQTNSFYAGNGYINNKLGIGTPTPSGKLDVSSPTTGGQSVYISKTDSGTPNEDGGTLYFDNNHLHDTGRSAGVVSGSIVFRFSQPTSGIAQEGAVMKAIADATQSGGSAPTALIFSTGNSGAVERMRIASNGNVGIGTTGPTSPLSVTGYQATYPGNVASFSSARDSSGDVGNQINITNNIGSWGALLGFDGPGVSTSAYHAPNAAYLVNVTNGPLILGTNNAAMMTINNDGSINNVGRMSGTGFVALVNKGNGTYLGTQSDYGMQVVENDGGAAAMSFHRSGVYAVNFGLDPDNVMRIGGWSAAANRWQLDMSGNETVAGSLNATTNIKLGLGTSGGTATPSYIDTGTNFSNGTTRDKLKVYLYNDGGNERYGFGVGSSGDVQYHSNTSHDFYINNVATMKLAAAGLGIGTASPAQRLDVVSSTNNDYDGIVVRANNLTQSLSMGWRGLSGTYQMLYNAGGDGVVGHQWQVNNAPKMTLLVNGNVGIGTTTPGSVLSVGQGDQVPSLVSSVFSVNGGYSSSTLNGQSITLNAGGASSVAGSGVGGAVTINAGGAGGFSPGTGGAVRISAGNGLGIGGSGGAVLINAGSGSFGSFGVVGLATNGGNVSIGTTTKDAKLYVNGNIKFGSSVGGTDFGFLDSNIYSDETGLYTSDYALVAGYQPSTNNFVFGQDDVNGLDGGIQINKGSGNVGIGNTNPSYKLDVAGDLHLSNGGDVRLSPAISGGDVGFYSDNGEINFFTNGGASVPVLITAAGNVGIGTTNPLAKFEVVGGSDPWSGVTLGDNGSNVPTIGFHVSDGSKRAKLELTDLNGPTGDKLGLFVYSGGVLGQIMTLQGNGNVGIGTTTPGAKFEVYDSESLQITGQSGASFIDSGKALAFRTGKYNGTFNTAVFISSTGNVGIGNTAPSATLHISPVSASNNDFYIGTGNTGSGHNTYLNISRSLATDGIINIDAFNSGLGGTTIALNALNGGNVGIGTASPGAKLDVLSVQRGEFYGTDTALPAVNMLIRSTGGSKALGTGSSLVFTAPADTSGGNEWGMARILGTPDNSTTSDANGALYLQTRSSYNPGTGGTWNWRTGLVVRASGNVGVGTDNPASKFTVNGNVQALANNNGGFFAYDNPSGGNHLFSLVRGNGGNHLDISSYDGIGFATGATGGPSTAYSMFITNGGNVGIGNTSPGAKLHVSGSMIIDPNTTGSYNEGVRINNAPNSYSVIHFGGSAGSTSGTGSGQWDIAKNPSGNFGFTVNGVETMSLLNNGNVGIGTTNPTNTLQLGSSGDYKTLAVNGSYNQVIPASLGAPGFVITNTKGEGNIFEIYERGRATLNNYANNTALTINSGSSGLNAPLLALNGGTGQVGDLQDWYVNGAYRARITAGGNSSFGDGNILGSSAWKGAMVVGSSGYNKVVLGPLVSTYTGATIGAHDSGFTTWADLNVAAMNTIFRYNGETEGMRLTSAGRLGLGTSIPRTKLAVVTGSALVDADSPGNVADFVGPTPSGQTSTVSIASNDAVGIDTGGVLGFGGNYNNGAGYANWASIKGLKSDAGVNNYSGYLAFFTRTTGSGSSEKMRITDAGNVGIGTNNPQAKLAIAGDGFALFGPNSTWGASLRVGGNGNVDNNASVVTTNGNLHLDAANGGNAIYLNYYKGTSGVNFGNGGGGIVGSVSSAGNLAMNGTGVFGSYATIGTGVNGGYYQDAANGAYRAITNSGTNGFYFQNNGGGSTSMYVGLNGTYAGRVGVGRADPQANLNVVGNFLVQDGPNYATLLSLTGDTDNGDFIGQFGTDGLNLSVNYANNNFNFKGGNVGIGTTTPSQGLVVVGNAQFTAVGSAASANDLRITSNGTLTTNTSDARLKENLEAIDGTSTLDKIMTLKPYYYTWKNDPLAPRDLGFLAQDMAQVFPDVTFTNPTDGYMGINYSRLPSLIIAAMQTLNGKVDALVASMKDLVVDTLAANKVKVTQGFEMKDQATGDTYCVTIVAGQWSKQQGECGSGGASIPMDGGSVGGGGSQSSVSSDPIQNINDSSSTPSSDTPAPEPSAPTGSPSLDNSGGGADTSSDSQIPGPTSQLPTGN